MLDNTPYHLNNDKLASGKKNTFFPSQSHITNSVFTSWCFEEHEEKLLKKLLKTIIEGTAINKCVPETFT